MNISIPKLLTHFIVTEPFFKKKIKTSLQFNSNPTHHEHWNEESGDHEKHVVNLIHDGNIWVTIRPMDVAKIASRDFLSER